MDEASAAAKKRILVVTPRFPYPVVGGDRLRIFRICEELSRDFELELVSLCESTAELAFQMPPDGVFTSVHRVLLPRWRSWLNCMAALFSSTPLQVAYYKSARFKALVRKRAGGASVVLAHLIRTAESVRDLPIPRVLEMTDAISLNYGRSRQHFNILSFRSMLHRVESKRVWQYEREMLRVFDACVLVSDIDRQFLLENYGDPSGVSALVCSNGVDDRLQSFDYGSDGRTILFIGNITSYQNIDAVTFFARDVFPLVLEQRPDARFRVVGRIAMKCRRYLESIRGVEVLGEVPDIGVAARGSALGVCSVRIGAGIQNKLLEYMALGLPAVTTSVGLEGLSAEEDRELLVADAPSEIASKVCRLLGDEALCIALSRAGRSYVQTRHSWSHVLGPLRRDIAGRAR